MMQRQELGSVGCALLVVLTVVPGAFGQILNPRVTVSAGGSFVKGNRTFTAGSDTFSSQFMDGGAYKARLTLDLTNHFSIEGVYGFGPNNLRITQQGATPTQRDFAVRQRHVQFNFLHFFTPRKRAVRPFLTTGIGAVRYIPTDEAKARALATGFINSPAQIQSTNNLSFTLGGGIEGRFSRWLGIRFDVRDQISVMTRFGLPQTPPASGGAAFPVSGLVHNIDVGAGFVFYFFGEGGPSHRL